MKWGIDELKSYMKQGRQRRKNRCVKWREKKDVKREIERGGKGCEKGERKGGKKDMKEGSLEKRKLEKKNDRQYWVS